MCSGVVIIAVFTGKGEKLRFFLIKWTKLTVVFNGNRPTAHVSHHHFKLSNSLHSVLSFLSPTVFHVWHLHKINLLLLDAFSHQVLLSGMINSVQERNVGHRVPQRELRVLQRSLEELTGAPEHRFGLSSPQT